MKYLKEHRAEASFSELTPFPVLVKVPHVHLKVVVAALFITGILREAEPDTSPRPFHLEGVSLRFLLSSSKVCWTFSF